MLNIIMSCKHFKYFIMKISKSINVHHFKSMLGFFGKMFHLKIILFLSWKTNFLFTRISILSIFNLYCGCFLLWRSLLSCYIKRIFLCINCATHPSIPEMLLTNIYFLYFLFSSKSYTDNFEGRCIYEICEM